MPIIKTKSGKVYKSKAEAVKQDPPFGVVFCTIERSLMSDRMSDRKRLYIQATTYKENTKSLM